MNSAILPFARAVSPSYIMDFYDRRRMYPSKTERLTKNIRAIIKSALLSLFSVNEALRRFVVNKEELILITRFNEMTITIKLRPKDIKLYIQ